MAKAAQMVGDAWADVRCDTITHCFERGGFSQTKLPDSAAAGDEAFAGDDTPPVTGICAPLEQLWESTAKDQLVPSSVDLLTFLTTEDHVVATRDSNDEALANCRLVNAEAGSKSDKSDDDSAK